MHHQQRYLNLFQQYNAKIKKLGASYEHSRHKSLTNRPAKQKLLADLVQQLPTDAQMKAEGYHFKAGYDQIRKALEKFKTESIKLSAQQGKFISRFFYTHHMKTPTLNKMAQDIENSIKLPDFNAALTLP